MRDATQSTGCPSAPDALPESPQGNREAKNSLGRGIPVLIATSRARVAGIIHDIQPRGLLILVKQPLAEGSVSVEFGAVARYAKIVSCQPKQGKYELSVVLANINKRDLRGTERYPLTQEVQIHAAGLDEPLAAKVVDLSMQGVGLELVVPLEPDEIITMEGNSSLGFGIVRHCTPLVDGRFQVGVEIFHVMRKDA
jgi:hypothetical protein